MFAVFIVPLTFAAPLGLALMIHRVKRFEAFYRSVYFLPTACSYVVAAVVWKLSILDGVRFGLVNTVLGWFGVEPIAWPSVTQPPWYWLVLVTLRLWLQVGFYMILFLAGLQRIPHRAVRGGRGQRCRAAAAYPPYARPPLVYLYYAALGSQQDFGHGSAGAVLLALVIGLFTVRQGRLLRFGRNE